MGGFSYANKPQPSSSLPPKRVVDYVTIYDFLRPLIFSLEPEFAHRLTIRSLLIGGRWFRHVEQDDPKLAVSAMGLRFSNPLGMAAGFDKDGEVPDSILDLGFGFTEIGTVTPLPQMGNPRPRVFRLPGNRALINRLGFNNKGQEMLAARLTKRSKKEKNSLGSGVLGINIGANKNSSDRIRDYGTGARNLSHLADYLTINVSSPNTPNLRRLQSREALTDIIDQVSSAAPNVPLLVKIAPDLSDQDLENVAEVGLDSGLAGIIVSNTTLDRPPSLDKKYGREQGGLSGSPLFKKSTRILGKMYRLTKGQITLVGAGGVSSGEDVLEKVRAGASLIQLYTALVYEGPSLIKKIKHDLLHLLEREGFETITDALGTDDGKK